MVIGNFVNCMAVGRAWRMYLASVFFGKKLVWDKTAHEFPTGEQLARTRRRLGELLQTWQAVDGERLAQALQQQASDPQPLGQLLLAKGWVDEDTLTEAIAYQADLPRVPLAPELARAHAGGFPSEMARRLRAVYIGQGNSGQPLLAVATPLSAEALAEATQQLGAAPVQRIASDRELRTALDALVQAAPHVHHEGVGEFLAERGELLRGMLEQALPPAAGVQGLSS
jgi:adsorption protein B